MALPDLSNSMYVARLRYIQSIHEPPEHRNPDTFVGYLMPFVQRLRASWLGREELNKLRAEPFYYYLVARTRYYDDVIREAVADGVQRIVSIGCGSDTRPYRFKELLLSHRVTVLECDQAEAIQIKQQLTRRWRPCDHVGYLPIDLNDQAWPDLEQQLRRHADVKTLVLMEGVSPYVNRATFAKFLDLLATQLRPGSPLAYDYKLKGVKDDFGAGGRAGEPFRLTDDRGEVSNFHDKFGLRLQGMEVSNALCERLLPGVAKSGVPLFTEDGLLRLKVGGPGA